MSLDVAGKVEEYVIFKRSAYLFPKKFMHTETLTSNFELFKLKLAAMPV